MMNILPYLFFIGLFFSCHKSDTTSNNNNAEIKYTFPEESDPHEGTWLQWPHQFQYGVTFRNRLDNTWIDITKALVGSENVHIIAYNETEKNRIIGLLNQQQIPLTNIDFKIYPTDDFWIRDNGPIYVYDNSGKLCIQDWGFNGWGGKTTYANCNQIPQHIGNDQNKNVIDLNSVMVNEGGSVEMNGKGTLMACKSSILNANRNQGMSQQEAEDIFTKYLGVTNFIWLDGQPGLEITDQHIDGFARFGNWNTIVTMAENDLLNYDVKLSDINTLYAAKHSDGTVFNFLELPLTQNNVVTNYGVNLGYKGSYCNYYIANTKVLVPIYNDPNDSVALQRLQGLYPDRTVVGIDCRNVYANGGMIHCVTQQQPIE